jgi:hypothetical protein
LVINWINSLQCGPRSASVSYTNGAGRLLAAEQGTVTNAETECGGSSFIIIIIIIIIIIRLFRDDLLDIL